MFLCNCYFFPLQMFGECMLYWYFQSDNISERADMVSDEATITKDEAEVLREEAKDAAQMANG